MGPWPDGETPPWEQPDPAPIEGDVQNGNVDPAAAAAAVVNGVVTSG